MLKILTILTLYLFGPLAHSAVEKQEAIELISKIALKMKPFEEEKNLEIKLEFKSKNLPGAFSKWEKRKKIGVITFSDELFYVENLDLSAVAIIACHEFGHFLGGAPFVTPKPNGTIFNTRNRYENMSVEGQADFFATSICLPLLQDTFELDAIESIRSTADTFVEILAGFDVHDDYTDIFSPALEVTDRTLDAPGEYPTMQCRVQTMMQGLSCRETLEDGRCIGQDGETVELRPPCWFKPFMETPL